MRLTVRRLAADDWQLVRSVRLRALLDSPESYLHRYEDEAALDESSWRDLFSASAALFVADRADESVGLVAGIGARPGDIDPEAAHLGSMWVDPAARGTGVADALVAAVAGWARETGHPRLVLWVYDVTPRAQAFYRRAGFRDTGRTRTVDDDPRVLHLMALTIVS